eukprot:gene26508-34710_t
MMAANNDIQGQEQLNKRKSSKVSWSMEEDESLIRVVELHRSERESVNAVKWSTIADALNINRTGKQCRERYNNHLNPKIKKGDWSEEEDQLLMRMNEQYGNKWTKIAQFLPGRSDNSIKNRWHLIERNLAVGTMSDVYLKAKNKFSSKFPPRVSATTVDGYHESDDSDSPCTKRFRPLIFEDLQDEPLDSILFHYSRGVESDGIAKEADRECGSPSSEGTGWIDDFLVGESLCTSTNPRHTSPRMGCLSGRFHSVTLTTNDLRPGLFQDMYNHAMY